MNSEQAWMTVHIVAAFGLFVATILGIEFLIKNGWDWSRGIVTIGGAIILIMSIKNICSKIKD